MKKITASNANKFILLFALMTVVILLTSTYTDYKNTVYIQKLEIELQRAESESNQYRIEMLEYKDNWLDARNEAYVYYDQLRQMQANREAESYLNNNNK